MARKKSGLEASFILLWNRQPAAPTPIAEYRFYPDRAWRFDFAWPAEKIAVEIEGGIWNGGRHTRGKGFEEDCHKYYAAHLAGWTVFRLTGSMIVPELLKPIADLLAVRRGVANCYSCRSAPTDIKSAPTAWR